MKTKALAPQSANPTTDLISAAKAVAPIVHAEAAAAEQQRRLTDKTIKAMKGAKLYRLMLPRSLGGVEADPVTALQVIEEIAYADGSVGWCLMAGALIAGAAGAFLGEAAVKAIFGDSADVIRQGKASRALIIS